MHQIQMQRIRGILSLRDTIFVIHKKGKKKLKDKVEFTNLENSTKFLVSATQNNSNEIICRQKKQRVRIQNDEKFLSFPPFIRVGMIEKLVAKCQTRLSCVIMMGGETKEDLIPETYLDLHFIFFIHAKAPSSHHRFYVWDHL